MATSRVVIGVGAAMMCAILWADSVQAKNPQGKQAAEEMEFGFKAARRGYWQEALERFEVADELTPNQARILNNIAVALEANGRFDEARTTYQAALALDPGNARLQKNYQRFQEFYATYVARSGDEDPDREHAADTTGENGGTEKDAPKEQHHEK